ncbi:MAG: sigma-70 family RNA polymerase sigma factor [bacterium]|nr:sigma-70 family RNA polymerase sigma factor [bacterium]
MNNINTLSAESSFTVREEIDWVTGNRSVPSKTSKKLSCKELKDLFCYRPDDLLLFEKYRKASDPKERIRLRNKIILKYKGLVHKYARSFAFSYNLFENPVLDEPDLIQEGMIGLTKAVTSYDYNLDGRFVMYAGWWVRKEMYDAISGSLEISTRMMAAISKLRKVVYKIKSEEGDVTVEAIAKEMDKPFNIVRWVLFTEEFWREKISLDASRAISEDDEGVLVDYVVDERVSQEDVASESDLQAFVHKVLRDALLTNGERKILTLYYGLGNTKEHTFQEISVRLSCSLAKAQKDLEKIKEKLRTHELWERAKCFVDGLQDFSASEGVMQWDRTCVIFKELYDSLPGGASLNYIVEKTAEAFSVASKDITRRRRKEEYATKNDFYYARQVAIMLAFLKASAPTKKIDSFFNSWGPPKELRKKLMERNFFPGILHANDNALLDSIVKKYAVSKEKLLSADRSSEVLYVRKCIVEELRDTFGFTFSRIGELLNRRATSIIHLYYLK